jgi:hypothetical protein
VSSVFGEFVDMNSWEIQTDGTFTSFLDAVGVSGMERQDWLRRPATVPKSSGMDNAAHVVAYREALGFAVMLAPCSNSNCATVSRRQLMARCSGVSPLLSFASIAAPQSSNALAVFT